MTEMTQHVPVLLYQVLNGLDPQPGGRYIDCTLGGAGHTTALLDRSAPHGSVLALDADPTAIEQARPRLLSYGQRVSLVHSNFAQLEEVARARGFENVDGVLLDLGLSSDQLASERGFGFQRGGTLDMRFDPTHGQTAADVVNTLDADALADLIFKYGEEPASRRIARAIAAARPIRSADHLARVIAEAVRRRGRLHPATLTFQALRIAVNDELGALLKVLPQAISLLRPGGRLAVIAFHSLEDRIVKEFFRRESRAVTVQPDSPPGSIGREPTLRLITPKPIVPNKEEVVRNPRARSAKLRIVEKR
ncbi:MAG TPA: 16S rRNA (cytosine(1402)-N(4))-methyltransferase RsmH [Anaerolineae bacterium]|nr:16S rRNA (cytosine(1402)-N(4))-methyltransferase RsmH [Anaerolineae bacterium]